MKNKTCFVCAAMVGLGLMGPTLARLPGGQVRADSYQVQEGTPTNTASDGVHLDGVVNDVDSDRDRVTFTGDDGHDYTLDTSGADIVLPDSAQPEDISNLTSGMRLHVDGKRLSGNVVEADRIRVLGTARSLPPPPTSTDDNSQHIDLRGTVESINKHDDSFVVHINDHTRTIFLDNDTDLIKGDTQEDYPLRPGDRVTVSGALHDDGTVRADTIILGRPQPDVALPREMVGRITSQDARGLTLHVDSSGRDIRIIVPSDTPVVRDGRPILMEDIGPGDTVRVSGTPDGDSFRADRVVALSTDGG